MLIRLFFWLMSLCIAVILAFFFVSNRQAVVWTLWPLPYEVPLAMFIPALVFLLIGLMIGFMMGWISSLAWRLRYADKVDEVARARSAQKRAVADAKAARAQLVGQESGIRGQGPVLPESILKARLTSDS